MTIRAIDPWVNVNMGDAPPPEYLVRVKEDTPDTVITNDVLIAADTDEADDTNNTDSEDTTVIGCPLPAAPANVIATNGLHIHTVVITWDEVPTATMYEVYRNTTPDFGTATNIGSSIEAEYLDYKPQPPYIANPGCAKPDPTVFFYWVVAINTCGESLPGGPDEGYVRPERETQHYVPDHSSTLVAHKGGK